MATPFPANGGSQASTRSVTLYPPKKRPLYGAGPCAGQTTARALVRLRDGRNSNNSRASGLLSSWKNIAAYLDRGVRTVQRWETTLGLPVHRMSAGQLAPVFAYEREIDLWLRDTGTGPKHFPASICVPRASEDSHTRRLIQFANELRERAVRLEQKVSSTGFVAGAEVIDALLAIQKLVDIVLAQNRVGEVQNAVETTYYVRGRNPS